MIKAIIVDDEINAIESLKWEIENFCSDLEIVESFTNPVEAIPAINYLRPDCVFLDVEMPQMDGFQLLKELRHHEFDLIFTTAYDSYALEAFKVDAIDYLLKPIDSDDLIKAVKKISNNKKENNLGGELKKVLEKFRLGEPRKISLPMTGKTVFLNVENILYCQADGNYTTFYSKEKPPLMIAKKLKEVEEMLWEDHFVRVHNSYLINIHNISEYLKTDGHQIVLDNGAHIPVSRTRRDNILSILEE